MPNNKITARHIYRVLRKLVGMSFVDAHKCAKLMAKTFVFYDYSLDGILGTLDMLYRTGAFDASKYITINNLKYGIYTNTNTVSYNVVVNKTGHMLPISCDL